MICFDLFGFLGNFSFGYLNVKLRFEIIYLILQIVNLRRISRFLFSLLLFELVGVCKVNGVKSGNDNCKGGKSCGKRIEPALFLLLFGDKGSDSRMSKCF